MAMNPSIPPMAPLLRCLRNRNNAGPSWPAGRTGAQRWPCYKAGRFAQKTNIAMVKPFSMVTWFLIVFAHGLTT